MSLIVTGSRTLDGQRVFMASAFLGKHAQYYLWSANLGLTPRTLKNSPWVLLNLILEIYSITPNKAEALTAGDQPTKWGNDYSTTEN